MDKKSQTTSLLLGPIQLWELYSLLLFYLNKFSHLTQKKEKVPGGQKN
jgi:hypothetical protein